VRTLVITSPDGTQKTFLIKGPPTKIIVDTTADKMSGDGVDEVTLGSSFDAGSAAFTSFMQSLEDATGADETTILKQIQKSYPNLKNYDLVSKGGNGDGKLDLSELEKAYEAGAFPPKQPDQTLINFFYAIDSDFKNAVDGITLEPNMAQMRLATADLVKGLGALYPDTTIQAANPEASGNNWKLANDIIFGDGKFTFTGESNENMNSIDFQWINQPS
jgi:hypothetical protein